MPQGVFVVLVVLALGLLVGTLAIAGVGGRALRRALRFATFARRELRPVAARSEGIVRYRGFAVAAGNGPVLSSPLDGRPALFSELCISSHGAELVRERKAIPTLLRDDSGELELDLAHAELELGAPRTWQGTLGMELPPGIDAELRARLVGAAAEIELRSKIPRDTVVLELAERAVNVGQTLHVCGTVVYARSGSSLVSSRPLVVASRPFGDLASRDALLALLCTTLALAAGSAFAAAVRALIEAKRGGA